MKHFVILLFCLLQTIIFVSCGSDNDGDPSTPAWIDCYTDADSDDYGDLNSPQTVAFSDYQSTPGLCVTDASDCDDSNPAINPGQDEILDNDINDDCDDATADATATPDETSPPPDEETPTPDEATPPPDETTPPADVDGDGSLSDVDCDDDDAITYPGANEICDEIDNDCDGVVDENATDAKTWYKDYDGDHYGITIPKESPLQTTFSLSNLTMVKSCNKPDGYANKSGDCNDRNDSIHPNATETSTTDGIDQDCDGTIEQTNNTDEETEEPVEMRKFVVWNGMNLQFGDDESKKELSAIRLFSKDGQGKVEFNNDQGWDFESGYDQFDYTAYHGIISYNPQYMQLVAIDEKHSCSGSTCNGTVENEKAISYTPPAEVGNDWAHAVILRGIDLKYEDTMTEPAKVNVSVFFCEDSSNQICWKANLEGSSQTPKYNVGIHADIIFFDTSAVAAKEFYDPSETAFPGNWQLNFETPSGTYFMGQANFFTGWSAFGLSGGNYQIRRLNFTPEATVNCNGILVTDDGVEPPQSYCQGEMSVEILTTAGWGTKTDATDLTGKLAAEGIFFFCRDESICRFEKQSTPSGTCDDQNDGVCEFAIE